MRRRSSARLASADLGPGNPLLVFPRVGQLCEAKCLDLAGNCGPQLALETGDLPHLARRQSQRHIQLHGRALAIRQAPRTSCAIGHRQRLAVFVHGVNRPIGCARLITRSRGSHATSTVTVSEASPVLRRSRRETAVKGSKRNGPL